MVFFPRGVVATQHPRDIIIVSGDVNTFSLGYIPECIKSNTV
jgi:hypothetical protein